jgi:hypothetical protein
VSASGGKIIGLCCDLTGYRQMAQSGAKGLLGACLRPPKLSETFL